MTADPMATRNTPTDPGAANRSYREVTDSRGRVYRVGETDRDILGRSRRLMVYLPWIAMMAISVSEYAYGSAEDTLSAAHHWTQSNTFWILSVWVFFQAGIAFPAGWLRERGLLTARRAMFLGAGMCLLGFLALSHLHNVWLAILGFGVVGGVGSGLIYATCINMVGKWFPERRGAKTGLLTQFGVIWAGDIRNEWLFLFFAFLSGFGGGAFYPMFAALTPDYFGENYNATNYGLVYSGKLVSGLFGGGLGSLVVDAWGYNGAYALAGGVSMVAAAIALLLRQPGWEGRATAVPTSDAQTAP
ncbi:MFS transporter [Streptomyces sp. NPDC020192]|uniref:MFS transporter n=1 Tax=Streptomyces sp. NPDC020192 TaxID=3365066 RepID=UPI0037996F10